MGRCKFCGLEIGWGEVRGVSTPLDPNMSDHRETCAGWTRYSREQVHDVNHERRVGEFLAAPRAALAAPWVFKAKVQDCNPPRQSKRARCEANVAELRRLHALHRFKVHQFSEIHFRIVGARTIDYWPSTGRSSGEGAPSRLRTVAELVELAMSAAERRAKHARSRQPQLHQMRPNVVYFTTMKATDLRLPIWDGLGVPWEEGGGGAEAAGLPAPAALIPSLVPIGMKL